MDDQPFRLAYLPALDGLRGIAILLVMGFHAMLPFMRGGFIGVDIFFVLSGFLITSVLIKEWDATQTLSIKHFYMRRILRLAPALLLALITLNIYVLLVRPLLEAQALQHDTVVTLLYLSNWGQMLGFMDGPYLVHTWSLAIEEQFYIVFPWFLAALLRALPRYGVIAVLVGIGLLSGVWRLVLVAQGLPIKRLYYAPDTRLDALLLGAALALICTTAAYGPLKRWMMRRQALATFTAVIAYYVIAYMTGRADFEDYFTYVLAMPLVVLAVWFLILYVVTIETSRIKWVLEWRPLVYVGRISYGLYLWHWIWELILPPVLGMPSVTLPIGFAAIMLSIVTASLSYYGLERPMLRLKTRFQGEKTA